MSCQLDVCHKQQQIPNCLYSSRSTVLSSRFLVLSTYLLLLIDAKVDKNTKIASGIYFFLAHSARYPVLFSPFCTSSKHYMCNNQRYKRKGHKTERTKQIINQTTEPNEQIFESIESRHLGLEICLFRDPLTERLLSASAGASVKNEEIDLSLQRPIDRAFAVGFSRCKPQSEGDNLGDSPIITKKQNR